MKTLNIVIGANYGDEGKGLTTAAVTPEDGIVILGNGGAQRGHTVVTEDGKRHVFHHFGSATLKGCESYACEDFIINPVKFLQEYDELFTDFNIRPKLHVSPDCRLSTPYDGLMNIVREQSRNKKGSTGFGIMETIDRYKTGKFGTIGWYANHSITEWKEELNSIRTYYEKYVKTQSKEFQELYKATTDYCFTDDKLIESTITALCRFFDRIASLSTFKQVYSVFDTMTFEQAQGLALDMDYDIEDGTPTKTGSYTAAMQLITNGGIPRINRYYVTRTYLTRHGDGKLPNYNESVQFTDKTNVVNPFQGKIRFAEFTEDSLIDMLERIHKDTLVIPNRVGIKNNIVITHTNELAVPEKLKTALTKVSALQDFGIYVSSDEVNIKKVR